MMLLLRRFQARDLEPHVGSGLSSFTMICGVEQIAGKLKKYVRDHISMKLCTCRADLKRFMISSRRRVG